MMDFENAEEIIPCVYVYENFIDNSEELIDLAKSMSDQSSSASVVIDGHSEIDRSIRNNKVVEVSYEFKNDVRWFSLAQKIWQCANSYAIKHGITFSDMEYPQLLTYEANNGFYLPHHDHGPTIPRIFSCVLYLNDVEEGGETLFTRFNTSVKPKSGRMILFPANYTYLHEALPPVSGEKNVIVTWFRQ